MGLDFLGRPLGFAMTGVAGGRPLDLPLVGVSDVSGRLIGVLLADNSGVPGPLPGVCTFLGAHALRTILNMKSSYYLNQYLFRSECLYVYIISFVNLKGKYQENYGVN